jgi:transcriptional regulator with XRE-family HTH domain
MLAPVESLDSGSPVPSRFGLRSQREAAELSLRALAGRSGFSTSYLSRVETGQRPATAEVVRLYAALGAAQAGPAAGRSPVPAPSWPEAAAGLETRCFGSEVRRLRMAAGKSLAELGTEAYLSRSHLGKIEQGDARGGYAHALALDVALGAHGRLTELFQKECSCVAPVAPDTGILSRCDPDPQGARRPDRAERAAEAAVRLQVLRVRSHQAGARSVLGDLGNDIAEVYHLAGGTAFDTSNPLWPVVLRYAELLGWTAQETDHDAIAMRWTRAMADWAATLGDTDALSYALIRQSQWARRGGDTESAVALARRAGDVGGISPRLAQFAAEREAQSCALAGDESACGTALERFHALADTSSQAGPDAPLLPGWGPVPDPAFERSNLLEATCLVDLKDFGKAAALFDPGMKRLGTARTGYARLAIRQAIACAHTRQPELACQIARGSLPTIARQGSASLRGDLKQLGNALNRYRSLADVRDLLPDLTTAVCAARSRANGS